MAKKKAAWTVMVYLAGDNNLTTECMFALTEMKKAAPGKQINVIAQFDPSDPYLPTHRYVINRNGRNSTLFDDIIDQASYDKKVGEVHFKEESQNASRLATERRVGRKFRNIALENANLTGSSRLDEVITDDTDTGSPITLYNFISFCLEEYPADHYVVVLSGHAGGTERDYLLKDASSAGSLTFNELKQVFKRVRQDRNGQPIDIVGMDNCLMSMGEICYEMRGLAEIVVGCESFSPASGWPYRQILERLRKDFVAPKGRKRKTLAAEAAAAIVEEYVNYYSNYWIAGLSVSQSALNVNKVEELRRLVDKFARVMEKELAAEFENRKSKGDSHSYRNGPFQDSLVLAHWEAQSYNGEQFVDLYDFCDCLESRVRTGAVARQCRQVKEFVSSEFVLKSCYYGAAYQYSYGVSLYFPWSQVAGSYWNLDFIRDSPSGGWGSFLRTYTLLTRRYPRGFDGKGKLSAAINAAVETRLTSIRMTDERMTDERMTDERMTDERMTDERMTDERMTDERMTDERMTDERMTDERMTDERMTDERMTDERMTDERMTDERMGSTSSRNPIHSMRNPPNVFFPDECIRDRRNALATQEILRLG
jgi:Clostripain family